MSIDLITAKKAQREAAGLSIEWTIPDRDGTLSFTAYPSTEAVKAQWIAEGIAKGWVLKQDRRRSLKIRRRHPNALAFDGCRS